MRNGLLKEHGVYFESQTFKMTFCNTKIEKREYKKHMFGILCTYYDLKRLSLLTMLWSETWQLQNDIK